MERHRPAQTTGRLSRRRFLQLGSAAAAGLACGCGLQRPAARRPQAAEAGWPLPHLEVEGSPYECGRAIGQRFARQIRLGIERRAAWFEPLRRFLRADLPARGEPFLAAAEKYFPDIVAELHGWADGSGVEFLDLLALNLKAELGAMQRVQQAECPGCSTLALNHGGRLLLAHNEDGDAAYRDLMFLLTVHNPGKPAFTCLSYPGILPGNGPAVNSAGLVLTTNFIASRAWRLGVPRYFLDRAVLAARSLDEALAVARHPQRAFAFHFNLGSVGEGRLLSVETAVDRDRVHPVEGLYLHTNHLVLDGMRDVPQDEQYVNLSSHTRYRVLDAWRQSVTGRLDEVDGAALVAALSSHQGAPYSPCRHPRGEVRGATLACSLFDLRAGRWTFYPGNPCRARGRVLAWPARDTLG